MGVQVPLTQLFPTAQVLPQAPQCDVLMLVSTQPLLHFVLPVGQPQTPSTHTSPLSPLPQRTLQAPQFSARSSLTTSTCRDDGLSGHGPGSLCLSYQSCDSRVCVQGAGFGMVCSTPCGSSAECAAFAAAATDWLSDSRAYCRYISVSLDATLEPPDYASVCVIDRGGEVGVRVAEEEERRRVDDEARELDERRDDGGHDERPLVDGAEDRIEAAHR